MAEASLKNGRIEWIDRLRATAFFLVVVGHTTLPHELRTMIYSFHMPLFFCISGMTANPEKLIRAPILDIISNNFKRLIIPFFWLNFFCFPIWVLTYKILNPKPTSLIEVFLATFFSNGNCRHMPSNALWFLPVLFFSNILIALLFKLSKKNYFAVGIGILLLSILGYLDKNNDRIWHINVVFTSVAFMFAGIIFMNLYRKYRDSLRKVKILPRILIFVALAVIWLLSVCKNGYISMNSNNFGNGYFMFYLAAISGSLMFVLFSVHLPSSRLLNYIGVNTILYLGLHCVIIRCIEQAFPNATSKIYVTVPMAVTIYLALIPLCALFNRFFPYAMGKTSNIESFKRLKYTNILFFVICFCLPMLEIICRLFPPLFSGYLIIIAILADLLILTAISILTQKFIPFIYIVKKSH